MHSRWLHRFHHHGRHPYRRVRPVLIIRGIAIELQPEEELHMAAIIRVGQTDEMSIIYLDQDGQPMDAPAVLDSQPVWSNSNPVSETVMASADGMTSTQTGLEVGNDTIGLSVTVGGHDFTASLSVSIEPPAQVLTSIQIKSGTPK